MWNRIKSKLFKSEKDKCIIDKHEYYLPGMAFRGEFDQRMYYVGPCLEFPQLAVIDTQKHAWTNNIGTYPLELMTRTPEDDLPYWENFWNEMTAIELHNSMED